MALCQRFQSSLALPHQFLGSPQEVSCFCSNCYTKREKTEKKGEPAKEYALPEGWVRLPLRQKRCVPVRPEQEDNAGSGSSGTRSTADWHRGYHGTKPGMVRKLLDNGELVPMGKQMHRVTYMPLRQILIGG